MEFNIHIDLQTGIMVLILGHFGSGLLGLAYRVQNKEDTIIHVFLLSRLFELAAWILIGLRGAIPDVFSILLGNSFLMIGNSLQSGAFLAIKDRFTRFVKTAHITATVASIVILSVASCLYPIQSIRIAVLSLLVVLLWVYPIYVLCTKNSSSILQKFIAFVYAVGTLPHLYKAYLGFQLGAATDLMSGEIHNVISFAWMYLTMLVGNMGLILMAKEKSDSGMIKAATFDELTNLLNRRTFLLKAEESILVFAKKKKPISFFLIDIDDFKKINDFHGHYVGDMVLKDFADSIKDQLRRNDLFGRVGGEEFTILLPETNEKAAFEVAERLRKTIEQSCVCAMVRYTVSIGVATIVPDETTTVDALYKLSDKAMYRAKRNGKNRIERARVMANCPQNRY